MEPSPLTQQTRPESFQQKIVELYQSLFKEDDDGEQSEGFWREFFVLRPDQASLQQILGALSADDLLELQTQTRSLFARAVTHIKNGKAPSDEIAFETLTAFLGVVLAKKYTNPSSDVINVVTGLDQVDAIFTDFVAALDHTIKNGRSLDLREKAIETALSVTSGAYHTGLISYFTHRDLFPSLMKYIQDSDDPKRSFKPFVLLGLLANYNKFEFQNPYRLRLDDFVKETTIQRIILAIGSTCSLLRDDYVAIQDDLPEPWNFTSTMTYLGLGALAPKPVSKPTPPVPSPEDAKKLFAVLPSPPAAILLATYDFASSNKLFCFNLLSLAASPAASETPLAAYLSLTSYLITHAHRSSRTAHYAYLNLLVIRLLIEDQVLCKRICQPSSSSSSSSTTKADTIAPRLCRQRSPYLPLIRSPRPIAAVIMDMMVDGLNHNLRRRLDVDLYILILTILSRLLSYLSRSRTRLSYHWQHLWRALLSLLKFLATYAPDLQHRSPRLPTLLDSLTNLIALALQSGDGFLPGAAEYDDLFYKLVESGGVLVKFRDAYGFGDTGTDASRQGDRRGDKVGYIAGDKAGEKEGEMEGRGSIATLVSVSEHYYRLLDEKGWGKSGGGKKNLSPKEVGEVIKSGYETLSIRSQDGLDAWERFREGDEKKVLKSVARGAVEDARRIVLS